MCLWDAKFAGSRRQKSLIHPTGNDPKHTARNGLERQVVNGPEGTQQNRKLVSGVEIFCICMVFRITLIQVIFPNSVALFLYSISNFNQKCNYINKNTEHFHVCVFLFLTCQQILQQSYCRQ